MSEQGAGQKCDYVGDYKLMEHAKEAVGSDCTVRLRHSAREDDDDDEDESDEPPPQARETGTARRATRPRSRAWGAARAGRSQAADCS